MRFKAGKNRRFNQYKRSGKLLMKIYEFDARLQNKRIRYGIAF